MKVYRRVRDLREDRDLRQWQLAEILNVSQRAYSYYENGVHSLTPEALAKLALFYHVSVDYLLELTDDPTPPKRKRPPKAP